MLGFFKIQNIDMIIAFGHFNTSNYPHITTVKPRKLGENKQRCGEKMKMIEWYLKTIFYCTVNMSLKQTYLNILRYIYICQKFIIMRSSSIRLKRENDTLIRQFGT